MSSRTPNRGRSLLPVLVAVAVGVALGLTIYFVQDGFVRDGGSTPEEGPEAVAPGASDERSGPVDGGQPEEPAPSVEPPLPPPEEPAVQPVRVTGHVTGQLGELRGARELFLLPSGSAHPATSDEAARLTRAATDAGGRFELVAPEPGAWRLSVGAPGAPELAMDAAIELEAGAAREVEVVLPERLRLEVTLAGPRGAEPIAVEALARQEVRSDGRPGRAGREGLAPAVRWNRAAREELPLDGRLVLRALAPGDYRLRVQRGTSRFESAQAFHVLDGGVVQLSFELPEAVPEPGADPGSEGFGDVSAGALPLTHEVQSATPTPREPGFHWQ